MCMALCHTCTMCSHNMVHAPLQYACPSYCWILTFTLTRSTHRSDLGELQDAHKNKLG